RPSGGAAVLASRLSAGLWPNMAGPLKPGTTCRGGRSLRSSYPVRFLVLAPSTKHQAPRMTKATVLIVDDEPGVRSALSGVLRDEGYNVEAVESGEACLDRVVREAVDVIVLDVWLPG